MGMKARERDSFRMLPRYFSSPLSETFLKSFPFLPSWDQNTRTEVKRGYGTVINIPQQWPCLSQDQEQHYSDAPDAPFTSPCSEGTFQETNDVQLHHAAFLPLDKQLCSFNLFIQTCILETRERQYNLQSMDLSLPILIIHYSKSTSMNCGLEVPWQYS